LGIFFLEIFFFLNFLIFFRSKGYGLSVYAETTNQFFFASDITNEIEEENVTQEDLARRCANTLLEEIYTVIFFLHNLFLP
jgi:Fe2+ transport system protein B